MHAALPWRACVLWLGRRAVLPQRACLHADAYWRVQAVVLGTGWPTKPHSLRKAVSSACCLLVLVAYSNCLCLNDVRVLQLEVNEH